MTAIRRVVTGLNAEGRSCALFDGPVARPDRGVTANVWCNAALPRSNDGTRDEELAPFAMDQLKRPDGSFMLVEYPPGMGAAGPHMHATNQGIVHGWRNDTDAPAIAAVANLPSHPVGAGATQ